MESLGDFVKRLSGSIGCHYHLNRSNVYSLKKSDTDKRGKMGVWGWVSELKRKDLFRIDTYKRLGDKAEVSALANGIKVGTFQRKEQGFLSTWKRQPWRRLSKGSESS